MQKNISHDNPSRTSDQISSGTELSYWIESEPSLAYSKLGEDMKTDVAVVGAGIAGLTIAYLLLKAGKKVIVVDDGNIGSGETGRTTAHLVTALDDRYFHLISYHGEDKARLAAQSHNAAIDMIEKISADDHIDCDFLRLPGYLFLHPTDKPEHLDEEFKAVQKLGLQTAWIDSVPGMQKNAGPCIEFQRQGQFHPMKYLSGLCKAIEKLGGKIFTGTHISTIKEGEILSETDYAVKAKDIVVATNSPINDYYAMHYKQYPYRTYVIGMLIRKGSLDPALWWDTGDYDSKWIVKPYHYVRIHPYDSIHDLLICGGEDHRTGQNEDSVTSWKRFANLEAWTKVYFPVIGKPVYQWSGQVEEPLDSLAFIGRNPGDEHIYIATGDSGNGMTHGTIAGMLITDLITGKDNPWEKLYDPSRKTLRTAGDFISELSASIFHYAGDIIHRQIPDSNSIPVGEGGILGLGIHKIALFRESDHSWQAFSAACPHQKCILEWNTAEKSFDCPCHGSRFTAYGKIINGPALVNLHPAPFNDAPSHHA